jgi:hypothetical protein
MPKIALTLDNEQLAELQMILLDGDGAQALRFLKKVIWEQVEAVRRKGMQSHLEKGQR